MLRSLPTVLCLTLYTLAHADTALPVAPSAQPSPAQLAHARFFPASVVANVQRGTFDPFDFPLSRPPSIYFADRGTMVLDYGQEVYTYRLRAVEEGNAYELRLRNADDGVLLDQVFHWRWLADGRVCTDLLGSERVLDLTWARLDRTEAQLSDDAGRRRALAALPALDGCYVSGDQRVCLFPDATATLDGKRLAVRAFRARLDCGPTEILALRLQQGARTLETFGLVDGALVEERPPSELCTEVSFDRKPTGRVYRRR